MLNVQINELFKNEPKNQFGNKCQLKNSPEMKKIREVFTLHGNHSLRNIVGAMYEGRVDYSYPNVLL